MSFGELLVRLDHVTDNASLLREIDVVRRLILGMRNLYAEYKQLRRIEPAARDNGEPDSTPSLPDVRPHELVLEHASPAAMREASIVLRINPSVRPLASERLNERTHFSTKKGVAESLEVVLVDNSLDDRHDAIPIARGGEMCRESWY